MKYILILLHQAGVFQLTPYMFRTVSPSIIRILRLYIQRQVYVIQVLCLLASKQTQNLCGMLLYVVLDS